jgi:phosphoserine phosphatase RsbU/P
MTDRTIIRVVVPIAILIWIVLTIVNLVRHFSELNQLSSGIPEEASHLLLNFFLIALLVFYRFKVGKAQRLNLVDMLWKVFATGLIATMVSILITLIFTILANNQVATNPLFINFFYHINAGMISAFLISTFVVYKRLVLYQKSKALLNTWYVFEYGLFGSIFFNLLGIQLFDSVFTTVFVILLVLGLFLSVNLKWVAYLSFKQKWKSILLILLVGLYLYHFFYQLVSIPQEALAMNLLDNVFIVSLFAFIFIYSLFSLLVVLFNLPTSSVFEQKLTEALNIQKLSQSIQEKRKESEIYQMFFDSSISAAFADAAFMEIFAEDGANKLTIKENLSATKIDEIKKSQSESKSQPLKKTSILPRQNGLIIKTLKDSRYKSMMVVPLIVKEKEIARIYLLKEVIDGFNDEMQDIVRTFANQASITIENTRLMVETVANERYKEEIKIAKEVQKALLPIALEQSPYFEMAAFSHASDEVGGDYYDNYWKSEEQLALIIGDVSGKGTSAAFHMSQMKGIFQSLSDLDLDPKEFLIHANNALSRCLDRRSFITVSYFLVNTKLRRIQFSRAGHCPTLIYKKAENKAFYFKNKGLGLGVLRSRNFEKYIQVNEFGFEAGDVMLLYTDGITEAQNSEGEELGYDRLKNLLEENAHFDAETIKEKLEAALYSFCGHVLPDDDYTALVIRFK